MLFPSRALLVAVAAVLLFPCLSNAQNVSPATAQNVLVGQAPWSFLADADDVNGHHYVFGARAGRSYCVELTAYSTETGTAGPTDTAIFLLREDGTTLITQNDDAMDEPLSGLNGNGGLSRACFVAPVSAPVFIVVGAFVRPVSLTARVVETTLFSNWFFTGGDYSAFTLLRNTTNAAANYTVNWRSGAGAIVATSSGSLPANGSVFMNARTFPALVATVSGTVEVVHNGSPDALVASSTIMSPSTGLSFDAPFMKRAAW